MGALINAVTDMAGWVALLVAGLAGWGGRLIVWDRQNRRDHELAMANQRNGRDGDDHRRWVEMRRLEHELEQPEEVRQLALETRKAEADATKAKAAAEMADYRRRY